MRSLFKSLGAALSPLPGNRFDSANGERALKTHYNILSLDGLGAFGRAELSAAGALIAYLELTQKGAKVALQQIVRVSPAHFMGIDAATRRNLELTQTLAGERKGSLLAQMDRSVTPTGARLLAARLAAPLTDVKIIAARHDAVQAFANNQELRLRGAPGIARGPRHRASIGEAFGVARGPPRSRQACAMVSRRRAHCATSLSKKSLAGEALDAIETLSFHIGAVSHFFDRARTPSGG